MKAAFVSALLMAGSYAMPALQKRATFTDEVVVTVWTTTTVFVDPTGTPAAFAERHSRSSSSSSSSSSPSSSSASSVPTTTTTTPVSTPPAQQTTTPAPVVAAAVTTPAAAPTPAVVAPATGGGLASGTGMLTYYDLTAGLTSCGHQYTNSDLVVALSFPDMNNGGNSNSNPLCGKSITITYNGVTKVGTVVDSCEGCAKGSIDLSPALFTDLVGSLTAGRVDGATWSVN